MSIHCIFTHIVIGRSDLNQLDYLPFMLTLVWLQMIAMIYGLHVENWLHMYSTKRITIESKKKKKKKQFAPTYRWHIEFLCV